MRQVRLSIGCRDWQQIVLAIGPEATGVLIYLRTMMRSMGAAEISVTITELADAMRIPEDRAAEILDTIVEAGYLTGSEDPFRVITLRSPEEEKAIAERERKRRAKLERKFRYTLSDHTGNSGEDKSSTAAVRSASRADNLEKEYTTEVFMEYNGNSGDTFSDQTALDARKEKSPRTPKKVKTLTESIGPAHASTPVQEPELPADQLEAEFIETIGSWTASLRDALKAEPEEVREAFYLYVRTREEQEGRWSADKVRIAWLAARRIPAERRAESILAASMGGWKTIRDCGSGCYFEKSTGRVVSLVRGPVESTPQNETKKANAELAIKLARSMRRA